MRATVDSGLPANRALDARRAFSLFRAGGVSVDRGVLDRGGSGGGHHGGVQAKSVWAGGNGETNLSGDADRVQRWEWVREGESEESGEQRDNERQTSATRLEAQAQVSSPSQTPTDYWAFMLLAATRSRVTVRLSAARLGHFK